MTPASPHFLRVLLLEDNLGDARLVREFLRDAQSGALSLDHAQSLAQAHELLSTSEYDAALIDLSVGDSEGIETFRAVRATSPRVAVIVLSGLSDEDMALQAVQEGAQDYLMKGRVDGELLVRAVHYAVERQQLDQQRRDFAAMVSHELRNPLATILGWAEVMKRTRQFHERAIDIVIDQTTHLDRLIRDLVQVAALDARQLELRREDVDIVQLVGESVEGARRTTDRHQIQLETTLESLVGRWDKDRVQQIVDNLLSNAIKYSPEGGPIVVEIQTESNSAWVTVSDSGIGLQPDVLPRLFSRFYRSEIAKESRNPGLGLGLHITRSLVQAHGGTIEATSTGTGKGSTFKVMLPLSPRNG
jgi:signal transduction histidine kinase